MKNILVIYYNSEVNLFILLLENITMTTSRVAAIELSLRRSKETLMRRQETLVKYDKDPRGGPLTEFRKNLISSIEKIEQRISTMEDLLQRLTMAY